MTANRESSPCALSAYLAAVGKVPLLSAAEEVQLARRIEAGVWAARVLAGQATTSSGASVAELTCIAEDGDAARKQMITANLRLVASIARKVGRYASSEEVLDAISDGNAGLIHAVAKFDYKRGFKFSTYATAWIRKSISCGRPAHSSGPRLPVEVAGECAKVAAIRDVLAVELGRPPSAGEITLRAGLSVQAVEDRQRWLAPPVRLDAPMPGGSRTLGEVLIDPAAAGFEDAVENDLDSRRRVADLLALLSDEERRVITLLYGLDSGEPRTGVAVAEILGWSAVRVSQVHGRAAKMMRDAAQADVPVRLAA